MSESPLPAWAIPDDDGILDYPVGPLVKLPQEMHLHIGAEHGSGSACGIVHAQPIERLRVGQPVCARCRALLGPPVELLRGRIAESGLTVDDFARRVMLRGPRTVYGWLSERSPIPAVVFAWLRDPAPNWPVRQHSGPRG